MIKHLTNQLRGDGLRSRLIRSAFGSAGIQATNLLLALGLGIVLARMLGPENYGIYAYAFAIMSLLMVAAEAGVPTLLMRELAASLGRAEWGLMRGAVRRGLQFVALAAVSVTLIGLIVLWRFADSLRPEVLYTIALMLFVLPFAAMGKTVGHGLWGLNCVVTAQFVITILRPALVIIIVSGMFFFLPAMRTPSAAMAAQLAAALAALAIGAALFKRAMPVEAKHIVPDFESRRWLLSAMPFMLIGAAAILNTQVDIVMLGWFAKAQEVGFYRVAVQGGMLVPAMTLHIGNAMLAPHFARLYAQGKMAHLQRIVTKSSRAILLCATPLVLFLILGGKHAIVWLFGSEFVPAYHPLLILTAAQLVVVAFGQVDFLLNMTGHERSVSRVMWQTAFLNILLNAALIPYLAGIGAAIATSASLLIRAYLMRVQVQKKLNLATTALGYNKGGTPR